MKATSSLRQHKKSKYSCEQSFMLIVGAPAIKEQVPHSVRSEVGSMYGSTCFFERVDLCLVCVEDVTFLLVRLRARCTLWSAPSSLSLRVAAGLLGTLRFTACLVRDAGVACLADGSRERGLSGVPLSSVMAFATDAGKFWFDDLLAVLETLEDLGLMPFNCTPAVSEALPETVASGFDCVPKEVSTSAGSATGRVFCFFIGCAS